MLNTRITTPKPSMRLLVGQQQNIILSTMRRNTPDAACTPFCSRSCCPHQPNPSPNQPTSQPTHQHIHTHSTAKLHSDHATGTAWSHAHKNAAFLQDGSVKGSPKPQPAVHARQEGKGHPEKMKKKEKPKRVCPPTNLCCTPTHNTNTKRGPDHHELAGL